MGNKVFRSLQSIAAATSNAVAMGVAYPEKDASRARDLEHLFVLGFWRSGTTLLHNFLCLNSGYSFATTWDCFNPQLTLFGVKPPSRDHEILRPMDSMPIRTLAPQEEDFALERLGAPSVYKLFTTAELDDDIMAAIHPEALTIVRKQRLERAMLGFVGTISAREHRPLVLKSPPNIFRVAMLREWFPNARYILISREDVICVLSTYRMFKTMIAMYAQGKEYDPRCLAEFVLQAYKSSQQSTQWLRENVSEESKLQFVSYDDLVADAFGVVIESCGSLGISWNDSDRRLLDANCVSQKDWKPRTGKPENDDECWLLNRLDATRGAA